MTIKHLGGIFGRNPTFNDAEVDGDLTVTGESTFYDNIYVRNDTAPKISILDSNNGFSAATLTSENGGRDLAIFAPQDIIFDQDGLETARFRDGGGLCFNGDTAAANALDDYEEGTWTPVVEGATSAGTGTYGNQIGIYTKVGRVVQFQCWLQVQSHTGTGACLIKGLPFTASSNLARGTGNLNYFANLTLSASHTAALQVVGGQAYLVLNEHPVGGGVTVNVNVDPNMQIRFSGSYTV